MTNHLPSALGQIEKIQKEIGGKYLAVFLDYDGTLTPIVARPDLAVLSDAMRQTLKELSETITVAIISGRKREEVESLVKIPGLIYAGSHGFDIQGPGLSMTPPEVLPLMPLIDRAFKQLSDFCQNIPGSLVENKKFAIAVHFRLVDPAKVPAIEARVNQIVQNEPRLRKTGGKKIFEIRANIPWDKGKALLYLLKALPMEGAEVFCFYLGDDETDEDAFAVLQGRGIGILVADIPLMSKARYSLADTNEVELFLKKLCRLSQKGKAL